MKVNVELGYTGIELIADSPEETELLRQMWFNGIAVVGIDFGKWSGACGLTIAPREDAPDGG